MKNRDRKNIDIIGLLAVIVILIVVLMALFPTLFTSYDPLEVTMPDKLLPPSVDHIFGTDEFGRDIFCRIVYGARNSIAVGLGTAVLAMLIGVPLGLVAGYCGGFADNIIMRIMDAFQSFPSMILAVLLSTIFDPSAKTLIVTIAVVSFPRFARLVRGQVLSIKKQDYISASKISGVSTLYMLFKIILPNCASVIIVEFSMLSATAILIEAGMSFLGLGIQPPAPAWGSMLSSAKEYINSSLTYILVPTFVLFFVVLSINTLGDRLRDFLDPKRQK